MNAQYLIRVYGKEGCEKCAVLKDRLAKALKKEVYQAFDWEYVDVMSQDGLVAMCLAECINPNRIPSCIVYERDGITGEWMPLQRPEPGAPDRVCKKARFERYQGLQTDYSDTGKGIISPKMITTVLDEVLAVAPVGA